MKGSINILLLLMLFSSCRAVSEEQNRVQLADIFPEIHLSKDKGIYIDSDGNKVDGKLSSQYRNGNLHAAITFSNGLIMEGVIRLQDGTLFADYSKVDSLYYHTQYWPDGKPQMIVAYQGNYNNRTEFHVWHENGTPVVASNPYFTRTWYEDGQLRMEIILKGGKEQGVARSWHVNGELKAERHFESDPLVGVYREWDENGELIEKRAPDTEIGSQ